MYREIDAGGTIRNSLGTDSLTKARKLRNDQEARENRIWKLDKAGLGAGKLEREEAAYERAKLITKLNNLELINIEELARLPIDNILHR